MNDAVVQQFDIVENLNPVTRGRYPFVVVLQHDRTSTLATLVVAPLSNTSATLVPTRLNPFIRVGSRDFVIVAEALPPSDAPNIPADQGAHLAVARGPEDAAAARVGPHQRAI